MALFERLTTLYDKHRDGSNASAMAAYMKHRFAFYGIKTPQRKALSRQALAASGIPPRAAWESLCEACFAGLSESCSILWATGFGQSGIDFRRTCSLSVRP